MKDLDKIPVIVNAGFKGLKTWQKIAVVLVLLAFVGLSVYSSIQYFNSVSERLKHSRFLKLQDKQFEDDKKEWSKVVSAYQDSMIVFREQRQKSKDRFDILLLENSEIQKLKELQHEIVSNFDSTDRSNELDRISAANGLQ